MAPIARTDTMMHRASDWLGEWISPVQGQLNPGNVAQVERLLSGAAGIGLAGGGYRRGGVAGLALAALGGMFFYRALSGYCRIYAALGIDTAHRQRPPEPSDYFAHGIHVKAAATIRAPRELLYRFWRNFENLPRFMRHLTEVRVADPTHSHWVAAAPAGTRVEWDAQVINDQENELIAWRSLAEADVDSAGSVRFLEAAGGAGTEVKVVMEYIPPAGRRGAAVARLLGSDPSQQVREDLRRLKRLIETGEIPLPPGQFGVGAPSFPLGQEPDFG